MIKKKVKVKKRVGKQVKKIGKQPATLPKKKRGEAGKPHRWKKGCPSPNPSGRPKGSLCLATALRKILSEKGTKKEKYIELMEKLYSEAAEGNPKLIQIIFDRIDGKVPDRLISTETSPLSDVEEDKLNEIINAGNPEEESSE